MRIGMLNSALNYANNTNFKGTVEYTKKELTKGLNSIADKELEASGEKVTRRERREKRAEVAERFKEAERVIQNDYSPWVHFSLGEYNGKKYLGYKGGNIRLSEMDKLSDPDTKSFIEDSVNISYKMDIHDCCHDFRHAPKVFNLEKKEALSKQLDDYSKLLKTQSEWANKKGLPTDYYDLLSQKITDTRAKDMQK